MLTEFLSEVKSTAMILIVNRFNGEDRFDNRSHFTISTRRFVSLTSSNKLVNVNCKPPVPHEKSH